MPYSMSDGKQEAVDRLRDVPLDWVIDVGAGSGTWSRALRPSHPRSKWMAVEVWGPYVERFGLEDLYDGVIVADIRYWQWPPLTPDLVIFGDVLEHMEPGFAVEVFTAARKAADMVLVSLPIRHYPQGEVDGNPWEAHVADWDDRLVRTTFGEPDWSHVTEDIGTYLWGESNA